MIRRALVTDFSQFFEAASRFQARTSYAGVTVDRPMALQTFAHCCGGGHGFAWLEVDAQGAIKGALLGISQPMWFTHSHYATDLLFFFTNPWDGVRLGRRFIEWALSRPKVVDVTMAVSAGLDPERMDVLYKRIGRNELKRIGGLWSLDARLWRQGRVQSCKGHRESL